MILHRGPLPLGDAAATEPALELATAHALVRRASRSQVSEVLRVYRPAAPVVVFGRREIRMPGYPSAVRAVRAAGFTPIVRATGGRAVAYTGRSLVVDHVRHEPDAQAGLDSRFESFGEQFAAAFASLGIDARVGPVPGEYCPGAFSVNARGTVKLVGTAQRVVRDAWLFSSLIVVDDAALLRPVLTEVYSLLDQDFDAASVGSLADESPGVSLDAVEEAVLASYGPGLVESPLSSETLALAVELVGQHRVP